MISITKQPKPEDLNKLRAALSALEATRSRLQQQINVNASRRAELDAKRKREALLSAMSADQTALDTAESELAVLARDGERLALQMSEVTAAINTATDDANRLGGALSRRRHREQMAQHASVAREAAERFDALMAQVQDVRTTYLSAAAVILQGSSVEEQQAAYHLVKGDLAMLNLAEDAVLGRFKGQSLSGILDPHLQRFI